jgi:flagellar hook-associated protein 2
VSGNCLRGVGLVDATNATYSQAAGQTAAYQINGGQTRNSNTSAVTGALPGVTFTLVAAQAAGAPSVNIAVGIDTAAVTRSVQAFVSAFNDLADAIDRATRYDPRTYRRPVLPGDNAVVNFAVTTRNLVSNPAAGATGAYRTP